MDTLLIDSETLQETLLPPMGDMSRVPVSRYGGGITLTSMAAGDDTDGMDEPEAHNLDPADYPDTTAYLNAIPGMAESLMELMNAPDSEFEDWND